MHRSILPALLGSLLPLAPIAAAHATVIETQTESLPASRPDPDLSAIRQRGNPDRRIDRFFHQYRNARILHELLYTSGECNCHRGRIGIVLGSERRTRGVDDRRLVLSRIRERE